MDENSIFNSIKSILNDDLGLDVEINREQSLITTNILDSMDWISFLTIVEEKFKLTIPADDAMKYQIGVVDNLIKYLKGKIV